MARHQPSRKGKKAWRHNVDISDIQHGLESFNEELIQGGIIQEKQSSDLYVVDTGKKNQQHQDNLSHRIQSLKSNVILSQRSTVSSIHTCTKKVKNVALKQSSTRGLSTTNNDVGLASSHPNPSTPSEDSCAFETRHVDLDLWDPSPKHPQFEQVLRKPTARIQTTTLVPHQRPSCNSLGNSHSYNPSSQEYDSRLLHECEVALELERRRRLAEDEALILKQAATQSGLEAERAESRAAMSEWDEVTDYERPAAILDESLVTQHKRPKRKTQSERNRILRRKDEARRERLKHIEKAKSNQLSQLQQIVDDMSKIFPATPAIREGDSNGLLADIEDAVPPPKPNRVSMPPENLEILLPDELPDSLRRLRPQGNILRDTYANQLARGSFEYRFKRSCRPRASVKKTEKWTFKDFSV